MSKKLAAVFAALVLAIATWIIPAGQQQQAAANVDVYSTPGEHLINGRRWFTQCEAYSSQITRCWTDIWMTQTELVGGRPTPRTGWHFNNLTYLAAPESLWKDNPLAKDGEFVSEGRRWKTSCRDEWTGPHGCRSFIWMKWLDYRKDADGNGLYVPVEQWVFNNVVRFAAPTPTPTPTPTRTASWTPTGPPLPPTDTPRPRPSVTWSLSPSPSPSPTVEPTPTVDPSPTVSPSPSASPTPADECGAPMPAGYALNKDGRPYVINNPGYEPKDAYNPISIANYIQGVSRFQPPSGSTPEEEAKFQEAKVCAMVSAGTELIEGSIAGTYGGKTVRWLPYQFSFTANPSTPRLDPGWFSGLGQSGSMSSLRLIHQATGDDRWLNWGQELANALDVPYEDGGIKHYINVEGKRLLLWFEEYPTGTHPTTVLNGNNLVLIGLDMWAKYTEGLEETGKGTYDERSAQLFQEGLAAYPHVLSMMEVPTGGGIITSYDLVRGYPTAPLRIVQVGESGKLDKVTLNGHQVSMPVAANEALSPNRFIDPSMHSWRVVGPSANTSISNGVATTKSAGSAWVGVSQDVPAGTFPAGRDVVVEFDARMDKSPTGQSSTPRASAQAYCPTGNYQLEDANGKPARHTTVRGSDWATYSMAFVAPAANCMIRVQLMSNVAYPASDTTVQWAKPVIRLADALGASYKPAYDLLVFRTPKQELRLFGTGVHAVQAYADGRWQTIEQLNATSTGRLLIIPERYTGRNLNYRYHEAHVGELRQIYSRSGVQLFRDYADRWVQTALNTPNP